jgi:hypothetical protein
VNKSPSATKTADSGDDVFRALEERGGAVWAFKTGRGSILDLTYAGNREGAAVISGRVWPEVWADHFDPGREGLLLPSGDEMLSLGWEQSASGGLERTWVVRTRLDRSNLRRDVDHAVAVLAGARGETPDDYALIHRPPGETDAGYAQFGCLFALLSTVVGDAIGAIKALLGGEPVPLVVSLAIFAAVIAMTVGFLAIEILLPRLIGRIPALRARAESIGFTAMLSVPAVTAIAVWLFAPTFGARDPDALLGASVVVFIAVLVWSFLPMIAVPVRRR